MISMIKLKIILLINAISGTGYRTIYHFPWTKVRSHY